MRHDLVYRDPRKCKGCHVRPGEWYYDDGRLLCDDCMDDAIEADAE